jgi:ParB family transcriptional regulator, chromosome partitioning protein
MAKEAERLLDGSGWLPEPLRPADPDAGETDPAGAGDGQAEGADLPAFLAGDDDEEESGEAADDEAGEAANEEALLAAE